MSTIIDTAAGDRIVLREWAEGVAVMDVALDGRETITVGQTAGAAPSAVVRVLLDRRSVRALVADLASRDPAEVAAAIALTPDPQREAITGGLDMQRARVADETIASLRAQLDDERRRAAALADEVQRLRGRPVVVDERIGLLYQGLMRVARGQGGEVLREVEELMRSYRG